MYLCSVIGPEFWAEATNSIVKKSQTERAKSHELRNDIDNVINAVVYEICEAWAETNKALNRRVAEMLEAKEKLQMHLHKVTFLLTKNWDILVRSQWVCNGSTKVCKFLSIL